jgi:hypothetical protein
VNGSSEKPHPQPLSCTERGGEERGGEERGGEGRRGEGRRGKGRKVRDCHGLHPSLLPLSVQERGLGG